ncbi:MAG: hypothetical protein O2975_00705 [Proteobacteria bacterium]|nr:hypothetical protein [Pseudomonadota bacterium]
MTSGLAWHESFWRHDPGPNAGTLAPGPWVPPGAHMDSADPKIRLKALLDASGLAARFAPIEPPLASDEELARVHARAYR